LRETIFVSTEELLLDLNRDLMLKLIPKHGQQSGQQSTNPPGYDPDLEFEFDTADVTWAIENRHSGLVDDYLRELGKLMTVLGDMPRPCGSRRIPTQTRAAQER
jgi:hypothetical protein